MFGMGTGGSLRLLSPERSGAPALCCQPSALRRSASSALPLPSVPSAASGFRTLKTAQVRISVRPSDLDRLPSILRHSRFLARFRSRLRVLTNLLPVSGFVPSSQVQLPLPLSLSLLLFLFPVPSSLFPFSSRSSPRPISITKLHTLPHFHR